MNALEQMTAAFRQAVEDRRQYVSDLPMTPAAHLSLARENLRRANNAILGERSGVPAGEMLLYLTTACAHAACGMGVASVGVVGDARDETTSAVEGVESRLARLEGRTLRGRLRRIGQWARRG